MTRKLETRYCWCCFSSSTQLLKTEIPFLLCPLQRGSFSPSCLLLRCHTMTVTLRQHGQVQGQKEARGFLSCLYFLSEKRRYFQVPQADFFLHLIGQRSFTWPLPAVSRAGKLIITWLWFLCLVFFSCHDQVHFPQGFFFFAPNTMFFLPVQKVTPPAC